MASAATGIVVNVTLPDAVDVGNTALGSGHYTITEVPQSGSMWSTFVFRGANGEIAAVVQGMRSVESDGDSKTHVLLSPDAEGILHLDRMFIEGQVTGYQFADTE